MRPGPSHLTMSALPTTYLFWLQEVQLREVTKHFGISLDQERLMSRCPKCNIAAFRLVPREHVASRVPEKVIDLVEEFFECGECLQVFWMVRKPRKVVPTCGSCLFWHSGTHGLIVSLLQGPKSYSAISLVEGMLNK